jgi:2-polyprenyl-6-methoxyphenol hydroxylase-like FAD-dependent oxidoreductase
MMSGLIMEIVQYGDFRKLLFDAAVSHGANVRLNTRVTSIDPDNRTVTLAGGEVVRGDVVIGADGTAGLSRQLFEDEEAGPPQVNLFRWGTILDSLLTISFVIQCNDIKEIDNGRLGARLLLQSLLRVYRLSSISHSFLIEHFLFRLHSLLFSETRAMC